MVARVMKKSRVNKLLGRTPRLSSISFRQSETFARYGEEAAMQAACSGHVDILKYLVEERKISEEVKIDCVVNAAKYGQLDCLKYLVEEAKVPLDIWAIRRLRSLLRAPRLRKLLARKRVPRTNGRRIR